VFHQALQNLIYILIKKYIPVGSYVLVHREMEKWQLWFFTKRNSAVNLGSISIVCEIELSSQNKKYQPGHRSIDVSNGCI
jgi:hypothetical protein